MAMLDFNKLEKGNYEATAWSLKVIRLPYFLAQSRGRILEQSGLDISLLWAKKFCATIVYPKPKQIPNVASASGDRTVHHEMGTH